MIKWREILLWFVHQIFEWFSFLQQCLAIASAEDGYVAAFAATMMAMMPEHSLANLYLFREGNPLEEFDDNRMYMDYYFTHNWYYKAHWHFVTVFGARYQTKPHTACKHPDFCGVTVSCKWPATRQPHPSNLKGNSISRCLQCFFDFMTFERSIHQVFYYCHQPAEETTGFFCHCSFPWCCRQSTALWLACMAVLMDHQTSSHTLATKTPMKSMSN